MKTKETQPQHTHEKWTLENCSNGGAIVCMGDPSNWNTQRVQIVPKEKAERMVNAVNEYDALVKENNELKEWKKQQIEITSPILEYMRNNAEKFNLKLGESIFKRVLELIKKSKRK